MIPNLEYIKEKFDYYNRLCFDGQLPMPPFSFNTRHFAIGITKYRTVLTDEGVKYTDLQIEISIREDRTEEEWISILVHEMIHYYIVYNNMVDDSPHGHLFKTKMDELNNKYDLHIEIAHNPTDEELMGKNGRQRFICVVHNISSDEWGVAVVPRNKVFDFWNVCSGSNLEFKWYTSRREIWSIFTISGAILRICSIEPDKLQEYLFDALELENTGAVIRPRQK